ncbi:MAG: hypothetical protein JWN34_1233 [Bryobacterales bacterium]|jgi:hypothetical protein|nr:hypothetical protein [Bryobacterales bacterium]
MNLEAMIKALKLQMQRMDAAISGVEALAEDEIQGRHDSRENIRPVATTPAPVERPSPDGKDNS